MTKRNFFKKALLAWLSSIVAFSVSGKMAATETGAPQIGIEEIKSRVDELARKINAPAKMLPDYGSLKHDSHPYIVVDRSGTMFYIRSERGTEYERLKTDDIDVLLCRIFESVTFWMASDYEVKNRIEDKDCRRMIFQKQEELLGMLNDKWKQKVTERNKNVLQIAPFDDLAGLRATFYNEMRKKGYSEDEIQKMALKKYPENK